MKKLLFLILCSSCFGANWYVSTAGAGAKDGTTAATAWDTFANVTWGSGGVVAGDTLYVIDEMRETLTVGGSGSAGLPITIRGDAAGSVAGVINGADIIADIAWSDTGGNIWKAAATTEIKQLFIDGTKVNKSRFPATVWNDIDENGSTSTKIVGADLNQVDDTWIGTEIFWKPNEWEIVRKTITDSTQIGTSVEWSGAESGVFTSVDDYGYYIEGRAADCDADTEWYWAGNEVFVYLDDDDPCNNVIQGSVRDKCIYATNRSYIDIKNIETKNSNLYGLEIFNSDHVNSINCTISFSQRQGILFFDSPAAHDKGNGSVENCTVSNTQNTGIQVSGLTNMLISGNSVTEVGTDTLSPRGAQGINASGTGFTVRNNTLDQITARGIVPSTNTNMVISNNTISNYCTEISDGGGIYWPSTPTNVFIQNNTIFDGDGSVAGVPSATVANAGIYIDTLDATGGLTIRNNLVYNPGLHGILLHEVLNCTILNNVVYDATNQLRFSEKVEDEMINNTVKNNIFVCGSASQKAYNLTGIATSSIPWGDFNNNLLYDLDADAINATINYVRGGVNTTYTLAQFQAAQSLDLNSIQANPQFVDAANADFRLKSNSPCLGIGDSPDDFPIGRSRYHRFGKIRKLKRR